MTTLADYLTNHLQQHANDSVLSSALQSTIQTIAEVGVDISKLLQRGALADIHGEAGNQNVQGEEQKKLDVISNDMLLDALSKNPVCAGVASEELDDSTPANANGELLVLFDPLDGSSNIDINMSVGTIFSILPYKNKGQTACNEDFLQKGREQLASGYVIYGTSTMLAFTTGQGVVMFALDPSSDEFVLIEENVTIDPSTKEYAINMSNYRHWLAPMRQYIDELNAGETGVRGKNFNMRWIGAMVGDVHRILCRGGLFSYPTDTKDPKKPAKLRLMYEANPMALLIEQAGGLATDAITDILDIEPTEIHQRVPVVLGSSEEVERVRELHG